MRKRRVNPFKVATLVIIFLVDLLILPSIVQLPKYLVEYKAEALNQWAADFNPITALESLIQDTFLLGIWGAAQLLVLAFIISIFWRKTPGSSTRAHNGIGGPEAAGNGQHGTARFQTPKEVDHNTFVWPIGEPVSKGGVVLGADFDRRKPVAWIDTEDVNSLILGATRSGKSRRLIFPTIWMLAHAGESMILTDPKGELFDRSAPYLRSRGYNVKYIDFREPGRGNRPNYMHPVNEAVRKGDLAKATKHAWSIAHMFVYQKPGSDKGGESIWKDGAESVIAALILAVAMEAPDERQKHMYSVYKMLGELGKVQKIQVANSVMDYVPLNDYFDGLPDMHPAKDAYTTAALAPERTRGSFFTNVASLLRLFADPSIRYLTAVQDHELSDCGKEKTAVFLIIPHEDKTRHPLAALYVDQTYQSLVDLSNRTKGRLPVRVNMLLDEFGNMPPFKDFDTKLTVSLGLGVRWTFALQDFSQLDNAYGSKVATTIRGNCQNLIYLLTTDPATAESISKRLGNYTIRAESSSYSVGGQSQVNHGASSGYTGRALLRAEEILQWPVGWALVIRARQNPCQLPLPDLSVWPADRDLIASDEEGSRHIDNTVPFFVPVVGNSSPSPAEDEVEEEPRSYMEVD